MDVLSLGCTNKFFVLVANDNTFWRRRAAVDYDFTGLETARTSSWKFIYRKLRNPRVFVWGWVTFSFFDVTRPFIRLLIHSHVLARSEPFRDESYGQLGLSRFPETTLSDVPFPVELDLPGVRVVSLAMNYGSAQIPFPMSVNTLISYFSCIRTDLSTCLGLMVACMSVVRMSFILSISH